MPWIGSLIAFLASWAGKTVTVETLKWIAWKALIWFVVVTVLPIILFNVWVYIQEVVLNYVAGKVGSGEWSAITLEISGLGAWFGERLKLVQCLSVIMGAWGISFVLGFIKR